MSIVWKFITLPAALIAPALAIVACSNSQSIDSPASVSLKDETDTSQAQSSDPCTADEDGDIVYKSQNGIFFTCEDNEQIPVEVDVIPLDAFDFPIGSAIATSDKLPELDIPECVDGDKKFTSNNSTYTQCVDGKWTPIYENWTISTITNRYLPVTQGKLIPEGNFNTPFTLRAPNSKNGGTIRCTFDGAEPDSTTPEFLGKRTIDSTTVVRCYEFVGNEIKQKQTETYFINENIEMPVVSISVAPNYVKDYLEAKPCTPSPCKTAKFWEDVEYPTHVEYFSEGSSAKEKGFEIDAGISIAGNYSRNQQKKSVSIVIRDKYQKGKLHYSLFETRPENNKFKGFNLRNNGNRFISDYIEDAMATSLLEGTNVDYQRSRQVIVFYNGRFHGIYDMREKLNEHFIETNYGTSPSNVNFLKHTHNTITVQNGSSDSYTNMLDYIYKADFKENKSAYDSVSKMLDIANYIEYMAAEIYYHNGDWPQNNVRAWQSTNSPWRFIAFDIDHGFDWTGGVYGFSQSTNIIDWIMKGGRSNGVCAGKTKPRCFNMLFVKLTNSPEFKQALINRAAYLYSDFINGATVSSRIDEINNTIDKDQIVKDLATYSRKNYQNACGTGFDISGNCLKQWSKDRDSAVRNDFRNYFNLGKDISISIVINGKGRIKLDGMNIIQKNRYDWTVFAGHPMQLEAECYAGAKFESWEDGTTSSTRTIVPEHAQTYTANCR